jgi:hypothetical protein
LKGTDTRVGRVTRHFVKAVHLHTGPSLGKLIVRFGPRVTFFPNIVGPHRTPWFISPDGGGRIRHTSWGCSAGEWACQQLPGWGEVSPLSPGVGTFPELFLGFGEANMAAQHVRGRRGGDPDAELDELAFDPQVAPPGVLPAHAEDQLAQLGIDGRTARTAAPLRSGPALELPAPALQRVGHNLEGGPPLLREAPAHGGEEGPVGDVP